jgi:hypothetical protein
MHSHVCLVYNMGQGNEEGYTATLAIFYDQILGIFTSMQ